MLGRVWLFCDPIGWLTYQAPLSMGFPKARIPEWVAISSSRGSTQPSNWTLISCVSCIAGGFFHHWATCKWVWRGCYMCDELDLSTNTSLRPGTSITEQEVLTAGMPQSHCCHGLWCKGVTQRGQHWGVIDQKTSSKGTLWFQGCRECDHPAKILGHWVERWIKNHRITPQFLITAKN